MNNPKAKENLKPFNKGSDARRNLTGRPKLTVLSEAIRAQLAETLPGKSETTYAEMIAAALVNRAINGDVAAAKEIADRCEGKARQSMSLDLSVSDLRQMATSSGVTEDDIIREAKQLFSESDSD